MRLSLPRIAGHRGFPVGKTGRGGHQGKGFPHFSRRAENQDVGERPGGEGEEGNVIPGEVVMRQRNEAEAGFLALRQGDLSFRMEALSPASCSVEEADELSTESCTGTFSGWLGLNPWRSTSRSSTSFPLFT